EERDAPHHPQAPAGPRAVRAGGGLRRAGGQSPDRRRVHRTPDARAALVGGAAPGRGSEGGRGGPGGEPDPGHHHHPELLPDVRQARGHDGHGGDRGDRVLPDLRARGRRDPDQPAGAPRGQARPYLQDAQREIQGDPRRGRATARAWSADNRGHRQRGRFRDAVSHAQAARLPAGGLERRVTPSRGGSRRAGGATGRQDDPRQSVFFLSLEDDLRRLFGSDRIARIMDRTGSEENEVITHPWVTAAIGQAQKRVELQNFQSRKKLLEYDDVMNQQ